MRNLMVNDQKKDNINLFCYFLKENQILIKKNIKLIFTSCEYLTTRTFLQPMIIHL